MDVDELIRALGRPGKYSLAIYFLLSSNYALVSISHFTMAIYASPIPYQCAATEGARDGEVAEVRWGNDSGTTQDSCSVLGNSSAGGNTTGPCTSGWVYDAPPGETNVLMEFDLVCDRAYLSYLATTIYFLGVMLGGLTFGPLAEKYGRRPVLLVSLVASVVFSIALTLANSYVAFVLIRLVNGFFLQGVFGTTFVLVVEQSPPELRTYAGTFIELFWAVGIMVLALASYLLPDWRLTQLAVSIPSIASAAMTWYVPESLRWSVMRRRYSQAETTLRTAARFNGVYLPKVLFPVDCKKNGASAIMEIKVDAPIGTVYSGINDLKAPATVESWMDSKKSVDSKDVACAKKRYSAVDMFRTPKLRQWAFVFAYNWFIVSVILYGLTSIVTAMDGNKHLILFLCGAAEIPTTTLSAFMFNRFGRKKPLCALMFIAGFCSTIGAFIPKDDDVWLKLTTTLALITRTSIMTCFIVLNIYTCEVFPTVIRNTSVGVCAFFTRFGGVVSPQVIRLGATSVMQFPLLVFGLLSLVGGILTLTLPETLHQNLPDTIEQAESMYVQSVSQKAAVDSQNESKTKPSTESKISTIAIKM